MSSSGGDRRPLPILVRSRSGTCLACGIDLCGSVQSEKSVADMKVAGLDGLLVGYELARAEERSMPKQIALRPATSEHLHIMGAAIH